MAYEIDKGSGVPFIEMKKKPDISNVLRTLEEQKLKTTETNKALSLIDDKLSKSQKKNIVNYLNAVADIESSGGKDVFSETAEGRYQYKISDNSFEVAKNRYSNLAKNNTPSWLQTSRTPLDLDFDSERALTVVNMIMSDPEPAETSVARNYLMQIADKGHVNLAKENNDSAFQLWKKFHQRGGETFDDDLNAKKKLGFTQ
tara:strand:+ start:34 stop:636 length:603 start_codon:yes stop_codon:yes gene_type:complete